MEPITPRIPQIDWNPGFERHWNGGSPAATHVFNTLSFLFPQAERLFIAVAREVTSCVDLTDRPDLAQAVQAFITQEAVHTQQHNQYNAVLRAQGYENVVHDFVERLQARRGRYRSPLSRLALVCAYEHYTAILGHYLLHHPQMLKAAPPSLALVWGWHAVEETEHKAVCFDLYQVAGGGWLRRAGLFVLVTVTFQILFGRLYLDMLRRDGCFKSGRRLTTLREMARFFFGRQGVGWTLLVHSLRYLGPRFHPWNQDDKPLLVGWLAEHKGQLRNVRAE